MFGERNSHVRLFHYTFRIRTDGICGRLGSLAGLSEANSICLKVLDYLRIPPAHGDCFVLLLTHPGVNVLGRFLPAHKINDLLLAESVRTRTSIDVAMLDNEGAPEVPEDGDGYDIMDLATFLEYVKLCQ